MPSLRPLGARAALVSIGAVCFCGLAAACVGSDPEAASAETDEGTDGSASTGGSSGTGGKSGTGGSSKTGGSSGAGGRAGAGGSSATGGNKGTGGSVGSGGSWGTGGSIDAGSGASVGRYTVLEIDVPFSEAGLSNVWEDVKVTATFTSPSGQTIDVRGFYHSTDKWKVRFAPWELGAYGYHVALASTSTQKTFDGSFDSVASNEKGFIRSSSSNPLRLEFETDGSLFNALGIGNCFDDPAGANWGLDGGDTTLGEARHYADGDTYFTTMAGEGKLNLFRWSVNNCAPEMWQTIAPSGNVYLVKESQWGDDLVAMLRRHGLRVYLDFFGWKPAYTGQWQDTASMDAVKRYVDYIVARYGAYVDFWEVCNETSPPSEWISLVAGYVKTIDPYHHLVSVSNERPDLAEIGIASPHWYEKEAELASDTSTVGRIDQQRSFNKPIIFGEQGNSVQNWDPLSSLRARIRSWTAFFEEGYFIFWDQQGSKNYMSGAANLYVGSELRGYFNVLQTFTSSVPADVVRKSVTSSPSGAVRAYGLSSASGFYVYLRDAQGYTSQRSGVTLGLTLAKAGTATFYDTVTGKVLETKPVSAGSVTVAVPTFVADVALAVTY